MKYENEHQLIDELIGEAVLTMLREKAPINIRALHVRLVTMLAQANDLNSRNALSKIIAELDKTTMDSRKEPVNCVTSKSICTNFTLSDLKTVPSANSDNLH